jgi:endogenous inhibitor of DNA gyrase (YacG/DUF329 family)
MPRVNCRCGEQIKVLPDGPDRIDCPRCGAHIRVRTHGDSKRSVIALPADDGFIRFHCPCGRRLKVRMSDGLDSGKCPDCGRVVPVPGNTKPASSSVVRSPARGSASSRTDELDAEDLARLARWSSKFQPVTRSTGDTTSSKTPQNLHASTHEPHTVSSPPGASNVKFEAGLRLCPRCGKPVHLGANICRDCGSPVPRR